MKFIFWIDPERAHSETECPRESPDLFLNFGENYEDFWRKDKLK